MLFLWTESVLRGEILGVRSQKNWGRDCVLWRKKNFNMGCLAWSVPSVSPVVCTGAFERGDLLKWNQESHEVGLSFSVISNSGGGSMPVIGNTDVSGAVFHKWMGVRFQRVLRNRIHAGEDGGSNDGIDFNPVLLVSSGDEGIRDGNCGVPFSSGVCSLHVIHFSQLENKQRGRSGRKLIVLSLYGSNETNDGSGGRSKWRSEGQRRKSLGIWEESVRPGMGEFWKTSAANVGEKRSSSRRNAGCTSQVTSHTCRWNTSKEGAQMSQGNASLEFQLDNSCNETKQFEQPVEKYHGIFRRWAGCRFGGEKTLLVLRVTLTNFSWPS